MSPDIELHEVVDDDRSLEIELNDVYVVTDVTPLEGGSTWISYLS